MSIMTMNLTENTTQKDLDKLLNPEIQKVVVFFESELKKMRTGRASTALVEDIKVSVYHGSQIMSLKGLALITVSDSSTLTIQPFDPSTIADIEKAISAVDLGVQPRNDGKSIKISFPPMSKERRAELGKIVSKKEEETLVSIRKIRHETLEHIKNAEKKSKTISEDAAKRIQKFLQNIIDDQSKTISGLAQKKIQQILEA